MPDNLEGKRRIKQQETGQRHGRMNAGRAAAFHHVVRGRFVVAALLTPKDPALGSRRMTMLFASGKPGNNLKRG